MENKVLIKNNFIKITENNVVSTIDMVETSVEKVSNDKVIIIGTLVNNLAHYGFMPSAQAFEKLGALSVDDLESFWSEVEPVIKEITGADRNMEDFVVYKNFPKEVLEMSQAQYWFNQIAMYFGFPVDLFAQELEERALNEDLKNLKVLHLSDNNTIINIFNGIIQSNKRWTDDQFTQVKDCFTIISDNNDYSHEFNQMVSVSDFSFKENAITFIDYLLSNKNDQNIAINIKDATDVLRLGAIMSGADISLRIAPKFKNFSRSERKFLLSTLEASNNLVDDISVRPEIWKRFLFKLHPGDYNFKKVKSVYNELYNNKLETFSARVERLISNKETKVFSLLESRPGDFVRMFHRLYSVYGNLAIKSFKVVAKKLTTQQLLSFKGYLSNINVRANLLYPPKGNWTKVVTSENKKVKITEEDLVILNDVIKNIVGSRLNEKFENGFNVDEKTKFIKLATNDQELASYGRGTVFEIPEDVNYLRSASYWEILKSHHVWFDNSWNFFDANWNPVFTSCWSSTDTLEKGAVFSGDPTNANELKGRACQMIDVDINKAVQSGSRYAVWNILAYSHISFDEAEEVLATLQFCEDNTTGGLYEPSRAQFVFPLKGSNLTKYIAYVDLVERKVVYIDANFKGSVSGAQYNESVLSELMPSFIEYLDSLPSIYDLFSMGKEGDTPILYSDKDIGLAEISVEMDNEEKVVNKAYVFKMENSDNQFERIEINEILKGS